MLEDGDLLDTSPLLQAGLILESLGDIEEAAVRTAVPFIHRNTPYTRGNTQPDELVHLEGSF